MKVKYIVSGSFKIVVNVILIVFSLSCIFPLVWLLNSALKTNKEFINDSISLAFSPHFENFAKAIGTSGFLQYFFNSAYLSILNVIFTVILSFLVGYFVSRYNFKFRKGIYLLFVSGMVIPTLSLLIPVFIQFKTLGLLNKWFTLLLPYIAFSMPFSVILMENYIRSIPVEMDEAAYMEGCSTFRLLTGIIFPMCSPTLAIIVINSFMSAWNEFPFSLVLVSDKSLRTISMGIRMFNSEHTINYPLYMAALIVSIIPILIIYLLFSKKIMEGMTVGAVKG